MTSDLSIKLIEKHFRFLIGKGYLFPSIIANNREFSLVYKSAKLNQAILSITYDGYGLPYIQITPLWLKNPQGITRTFALIEIIKLLNPEIFKKLDSYNLQINTENQLDYCLQKMAEFLEKNFSEIVSPNTLFVEKIELSR